MSRLTEWGIQAVRSVATQGAEFKHGEGRPCVPEITLDSFLKNKTKIKKKSRVTTDALCNSFSYINCLTWD